MSKCRRNERVWALLLLLLVSGVAAAENVDPDDDGSRYAWAENVGWINAGPGSCGGCGVEVTDFALTGWMWSENAGWISLSCQNTGSCAVVPYGVANDGAGNLSGFAWAENAGWVNFAPSGERAVIDPASGELSGHLWAENLGWISLACTNRGTCGSVDYGIRTGWCDSVSVPPAGTPEISVARSGSSVELSGLALAGADWFEVVRGELGPLQGSGGDFATAESCVADNVVGLSITVSGTPEPPPGDGYWYLVRGANCRGKASYDSGGPGQAGPRDAGVSGSAADCP